MLASSAVMKSISPNSGRSYETKYQWREGGFNVRMGSNLWRASAPAVPVLIGLLCCTALNAPAQEGALIFQADFEAPAYVPGTIQGQGGWTVQQGRAEVTEGEGRNGTAGLVLEPMEPFSQTTLTLNSAAQAASPVFLDFHVSPAATDDQKLEEMLDIDGARIGFFRSPEAPDRGYFKFFHGDGKGGGSWVGTHVTLTLDETTGRPTEWVRLTVREDFENRSWDLWIDGHLAAADAGFHDLRADHTRSYVIMGDTVERLALDDLTIGGANPLGPDKDRDGIPDADEALIGSNPDLADRDGSDGAGKSFHDKWLALEAGEPGASTTAPASPSFSKPSAVTRGAFSLTLSSPGSAAVYFTTDGSTPTPATAQTYSGPIEIKSTTVIRARAADQAGHLSATSAAAWVFADHVAGQKRPADWPESVSEGDRSYPLDPRMRVSDEGGGGIPMTAEVATAFEKAPVVVLALPEDALFGPAGVYENSTAALRASADVAWMDSVTGRAGGVGEASIRVSGESSRSHDVTLKHSLRLSMPATVDAGPVFGTASFPCTQILLRHPTQDSWAVSGSHGRHRAKAKYVMDAWASQWLGGQGRSALRHQWVHVFLNGTYWGVYEAVEQHDGAFAARHPDAGAERHLLVPEAGGRVRAVLGSAEGWQVTLQKLRLLSSYGDSSTDEAWEKGSENIDRGGLIDYMLWNWWLGNYDWPLKNWLISHEGSKWRFISWDAELTGNGESASGTAARLATDPCGPAAAFTALSRWPRFREAVRSRFAELCANGAPLSASGASKSLEIQEALLTPLIPAESARWGGVYQPVFLTPSDWRANLQVLRDQFIPGRAATVSSELEAWLAQRAAESRRPAQAAVAEPAEIVPVEDEKTKDSDGDGLPDVWEIRYGLDPFNPEDALADADGDGLRNFEEFLRKSNPLKKDPVTYLNENSPGVHSKFVIRESRKAAALPAPGKEAKEADSPAGQSGKAP